MPLRIKFWKKSRKYYITNPTPEDSVVCSSSDPAAYQLGQNLDSSHMNHPLQHHLRHSDSGLGPDHPQDPIYANGAWKRQSHTLQPNQHLNDHRVNDYEPRLQFISPDPIYANSTWSRTHLNGIQPGTSDPLSLDLDPSSSGILTSDHNLHQSKQELLEKLALLPQYKEPPTYDNFIQSAYAIRSSISVGNLYSNNGTSGHYMIRPFLDRAPVGRPIIIPQNHIIHWMIRYSPLMRISLC